MITRRDWLRISASATAALSLNPRMLAAMQSGAVRTRPVPKTGEEIPISARRVVVFRASHKLKERVERNAQSRHLLDGEKKVLERA